MYSPNRNENCCPFVDSCPSLPTDWISSLLRMRPHIQYAGTPTTHASTIKMPPARSMYDSLLWQLMRVSALSTETESLSSRQEKTSKIILPSDGYLRSMYCAIGE